MKFDRPNKFQIKQNYMQFHKIVGTIKKKLYSLTLYALFCEYCVKECLHSIYIGLSSLCKQNQRAKKFRRPVVMKKRK